MPSPAPPPRRRRSSTSAGWSRGCRSRWNWLPRIEACGQPCQQANGRQLHHHRRLQTDVGIAFRRPRHKHRQSNYNHRNCKPAEQLASIHLLGEMRPDERSSEPGQREHGGTRPFDATRPGLSGKSRKRVDGNCCSRCANCKMGVCNAHDIDQPRGRKHRSAAAKKCQQRADHQATKTCQKQGGRHAIRPASRHGSTAQKPAAVPYRKSLLPPQR